MRSIQIGVSVHGQSFAYVRDCLTSCLRQRSLDLRIDIHIRIDGDGEGVACSKTRRWLRCLSGNETQVVLEESSERLGPFGSYAAIFKGGKATFLCQVDADDCLAPHALSRAVSVLDQFEEASFLYSDCLEIDEDGCPIRLSERQSMPYSQENLLVQFMTFHLRLIRRRDYDAVGGYRSDLMFTGDYDLSLKLSEIGDVIYLKRPLYFYRVHQASDSQRHKKAVDREALAVSSHALQRRGLKDRLRLSQSEDGSLRLEARN